MTVGQFSSQADWPGIGGQLARKYRNGLDNYGLTPEDIRTSGDPTSGFAMRVRKDGLIEIREQQIPLYRTWDLALYAMVSAVHNFERANPKSTIPAGAPELAPPSIGQPVIQYAEYMTPQTVEEKAQAFELGKQRMALGLDSPITLYLGDHPGETEDEARAAITKNKADTSALQPPAEAPPGAADAPVDPED